MHRYVSVSFCTHTHIRFIVCIFSKGMVGSIHFNLIKVSVLVLWQNSCVSFTFMQVRVHAAVSVTGQSKTLLRCLYVNMTNIRDAAVGFFFTLHVCISPATFICWSSIADLCNVQCCLIPGSEIHSWMKGLFCVGFVRSCCQFFRFIALSQPLLLDITVSGCNLLHVLSFCASLSTHFETHILCFSLALAIHI